MRILHKSVRTVVNLWKDIRGRLTRILPYGLYAGDVWSDGMASVVDRWGRSRRGRAVGVGGYSSYPSLTSFAAVLGSPVFSNHFQDPTDPVPDGEKPRPPRDPGSSRHAGNGRCLGRGDASGVPEEIRARLSWWDRLALRLLARRGERIYHGITDNPAIVAILGPDRAREIEEESMNSVLEDHLLPPKGYR